MLTKDALIAVDDWWCKSQMPSRAAAVRELLVRGFSAGPATPGRWRQPAPRSERLQIMLTKDELIAVDDWRCKSQMPSRAAAVRELMVRGLSAEGSAVVDTGTKSGGFSSRTRYPARE